MSQFRISNRVSMALVYGGLLFGAAACQPGSGSDTETFRPRAGQKACSAQDGNQTACQKSGLPKLIPDDENGVGATCTGVKGKAFAQSTGSSKSFARRNLDREIEIKLGRSVEDSDSFEIKCTNPNGRAATYVECSAYERYETKDNWVKKEIRSDGNFRDTTAEDDLKQVVERMRADKIVFRNASISKVLPRELSSRGYDSGEAIWKLTYEVPGC